MKCVLLAGSALAISLYSQALAQSVTVEIVPEQRTKIKDYVTRERIAPVTVNERITVGVTLPADVELRSVPSNWGQSLSKYRYVYHDNRVVLVDPSSRKIVRIIE